MLSEESHCSGWKFLDRELHTFVASSAKDWGSLHSSGLQSHVSCILTEAGKVLNFSWHLSDNIRLVTGYGLPATMLTKRSYEQISSPLGLCTGLAAPSASKRRAQ